MVRDDQGKGAAHNDDDQRSQEEEEDHAQSEERLRLRSQRPGTRRRGLLRKRITRGGHAAIVARGCGRESWGGIGSVISKKKSGLLPIV
jgi:hypothetical protein